MNDGLEELIRDALTIPAGARLHLLQVGNNLAGGSLVVLAFVDREPHPRAALKLPRTPGLTAALDREWQTLDTLRAAGYDDLEFVPEPLRAAQLDACPAYLYRAFPGRTMRSILRTAYGPRARERTAARFAPHAASLLARLHAKDLEFAPASRMAECARRDAADLSSLVSGIPAHSAQLWASVIDELDGGGLELPFGRVHGDFSPANLVVAGAGARTSFGLLDWEHSEPAAPALLDAFRFANACGLVLRPGDPMGDRMRRVGEPQNLFLRAMIVPYLEGIGAGALAAELVAGRAPLTALWTAFWLRAALIEQHRRDDPGTIGTGTYLDGLLAQGAPS